MNQKQTDIEDKTSIYNIAPQGKFVPFLEYAFLCNLIVLFLPCHTEMSPEGEKQEQFHTNKVPT